MMHTDNRRSRPSTRPIRYYRGYNLALLPTGGWGIYWGDLLSQAPTLEEAEDIVDGWLDAR